MSDGNFQGDIGRIYGERKAYRQLAKDAIESVERLLHCTTLTDKERTEIRAHYRTRLGRLEDGDAR